MRPRHWLYTIPLRIRSLFKRNAADNELDEELQYHVEQKTQEFISKGFSEKEARYTALREFQGVEQSKEKCRDQRKVNWLQDLAQDLRFGTRMLRKNPGFTAVAILTLAIGIGANAAIFSVVNAVLLRPLPYPSPDRIVAIEYLSPIEFVLEGDGVDVHMAWTSWANNTLSFDRIAAYMTGELNLSAAGAEPERVAASEVSQNFFETFGLPPIAGRTFLPAEEVPGHASIAVFSATLCRSFGTPRDVVGKTVLLNGKPTVVIGVMPFGFEFPEKTLLWLPTAWNLHEEMLLEPELHFDAVGRLKPGVSPRQAAGELAAIQARVPSAGNDLPKANVVSLHDKLAGSSKPALLILLGAVGFVLLIACADVANLLLARAVKRQREIALRAALGASRVRLVRQGLTESLLLSAIGGVGGLVLGYWTLHAVRRFIPAGMFFVQDINLDIHVLLFLLGISLLSGFIFGLFPVAHALRLDINEPLKESSSNSPSKGSFLGRTRGILAVTEVALALVLLAGAGLLIKSFWRLVRVDTGFHAESVLTSRVTLPLTVYQKPSQRAVFFAQTLQKIAAIPGVGAASYTSHLPFGEGSFLFRFAAQIEHESPAHLGAAQKQFAVFYEISPNYFRTMGIPLLAGRVFNDGDRAGVPKVVIISSRLAELYWPGENPVGKRIRDLPTSGQQPDWIEIVGVVGNTKRANLNERPALQYYTPVLQAPPASAFLAIRVSGDPAATVTAIRQAVGQVDSTLPLSEFRFMSDRISESVAEPRFRTLLLGIFAGLALILAAAGIYGVMSYNVAQRTREIGIRVALGADRRDVFRLVLGHTLKLTLIGVAIGLAASWGLTRLLASALYSVTPHDFSTLAAVSILLSGVALLASYIPARRAMRVDPLVALRYE